jgi:hypothetical protein
MADNVAITAGTGTTIGADDVGAGVLHQRVKVTWGPDGTGNDTDIASGKSLPTQLRTAAGDTILASAHVSATFTPAASSHTALDCVGAAQNFASIGNSAKGIEIIGASLLINSGTAVASNFRLYLYSVTPPSATADDATWDLVSGDQASFLGYVDLGTPVDLGSTQWVQVGGLQIPVLLAGTGLFAYLTVSSTVTLAAVSHIVKLHAIPLG